MQISQETFTWLFKDPDWKNKFIIGSALVFAASAVPVIGWLGIFVVSGYGLLLMRAAMRGESLTLPKWENFGALFVDGFKAALSTAGFWIPGILAFICAFGSWFGFLFSLPSSRSTYSALPATFPIVFIAYFLGLMIGISLSYLAYGIAPLSVAQYLRTGQIGAGYRVREMYRIVRADLGAYFLAWVAFLGLSVLLSVVTVFAYTTIILCSVLPFLIAPIGFYFNLMWAALFGAAYRESIAKIPDLGSASG